LFRSVHNRSLHYLRKSKREILHGDECDMTVGKDSDDEMPEAVVARMEACELLQKLVRKLSEADRQLIRLKYFEGLKYREISERTGLSIGNVGYRLHTILQRLASELHPLGIDEQS
jgi:RNA polymerase sigma-70 factor (ECF subfamily)